MNKQLIWITILIVGVSLAGVATFFIWQNRDLIGFIPDGQNRDRVEVENLGQRPSPTMSEEVDLTARPALEIIAQNLAVPWEVVFTPSGDIFVTERPGRVRLIDENGLREQPLVTLAEVWDQGEGGLLGMDLHPDFENNRLVYLYYTYRQDNQTLNRIIRLTYEGDALVNQDIIFDNIPGSVNHNGGRIAFGPDGYLYVTTGDAGQAELAQNSDNLAGKILRLTPEGEPAPGNPFGNAIYSYGHRNAQGLAWDAQGRLWSTEHGRSGALSGLDELNLIEPGVNYGWPEVEGDEATNDLIQPELHSGPDVTWAPAALAWWQDQLFFVGLRGRTLYQVDPQDPGAGWQEHFAGQFGRLRVAKVGPDGALYLGTSNRDGRGRPSANDDQIIRVNYLE